MTKGNNALQHQLDMRPEHAFTSEKHKLNGRTDHRVEDEDQTTKDKLREVLYTIAYRCESKDAATIAKEALQNIKEE